MNKKQVVYICWCFLASSCYICQSCAMDVSGASGRETDSIKTRFSKSREGIEYAIAELQKAFAPNIGNQDSMFNAISVSLLVRLIQDNSCATEDSILHEHDEHVKAIEAQVAKLVALTGRVDTHEKFATELAALRSKVATHDNLVDTLASLKSEIDGLSSSVFSRFVDSEVREKTELARMTQAHDQVLKTLAALAGKVDAHDSLVPTVASLCNSLSELSKSVPARFSAIESRLGSMDTRMNAHDQVTKALAALAGKVDAIHDCVSTHFSTVDSRLGAIDTRMGTFASQVCVNATAASLNSAVEGHGSQIVALEKRLGTMDTLMGTFASQVCVNATAASLNRAVEGLSSKSAGLESHLGAMDTRMGTLAGQASLAAFESRLKAVEGVPSRASAIESRLGAMDTRMTGFASQADLAHFCCNLNAVEDKRRAMESRLATVEGSSAKSSGLESRLSALEKDEADLVRAHVVRRGETRDGLPRPYLHDYDLNSECSSAHFAESLKARLSVLEEDEAALVRAHIVRRGEIRNGLPRPYFHHYDL